MYLKNSNVWDKMPVYPSIDGRNKTFGCFTASAKFDFETHIAVDIGWCQHQEFSLGKLYAT